MKASSSPLFTGGLLVSLAIMAGLIAIFVPPDMDDFIQFHALACWYYPNAALHISEEPCNGALNVKLLGVWEWARAYDYIGSAYSFLYYPLFLLWPHWYSASLLGVLLMIPGVLAASRLLGVRMDVAALALLPFPVLFYTLRDNGQVTLQLALLYVLPWLAYRTVCAKRTSAWWLLNVAGGLLLALGVESKPVLLYFMPSIAIAAMASCWHLRPGWRVATLLLARLWPGLLLASGLLLLLFTATVGVDETYYRHLMGKVPVAHSLWEQATHGFGLVKLYWLAFPNHADLTYGVYDAGWRGFFVTLPFWVAMGIAAALAAKTGDARLWKAKLLILASLAGVLAVGMDVHATHPHHLLPPLYYLLGACAVALQIVWERRHELFGALASTLLFSQILSTLAVISQTPVPERGWERMEALAFIDEQGLSARTVINHMDWGTYYPSALYGDHSQAVTFFAPMWLTAETARLLNRDMLAIKRSNNSLPDYVQPKMRKIYPPEGREGMWEVWVGKP